MSIEMYLKWKDDKGNEFRPVALTGSDLLQDRLLNKGTAFTQEERRLFNLDGLLPPNVQNIEEQLERSYKAFKGQQTPIKKYINLRSLQDRNETLFYALLSRHIDEMTPIIYTPTVGKACQQFSHRFQGARGLYLTQSNIDHMGEMAQSFNASDIHIIVVTDSQGILGIGDQGVGGMGIPIGKLSLYTLAAGIHPANCLPIVLDVGTNNQELLYDPMYLGVPHERISGAEYDLFIQKFVEQVKIHFPNAVLQWEDFSKSNAFNNLNHYRRAIPSFNDDIQGTGAVVLGGIYGAAKMKQERITDQTFAVYGAGAGGVGVADQIFYGLLHAGLSAAEARERIYILDSRGVVFDDRPGLDEYKKRYAKPSQIMADWHTENAGSATLAELLEHVPVTVLIGCSGIGGAFNESHVKSMLKHCERPMIFPLSNPTSNCEAEPELLYQWSDGKAIVATGSPYADVQHGNKTYRVGQGNNVFIFPGVGLAAILTKVEEIEPVLFTEAAIALAECVTEHDLAEGAIYPPISKLREVATHVATRTIHSVLQKEPEHPLHDIQDLDAYIQDCMWEPNYLPYKRV